MSACTCMFHIYSIRLWIENWTSLKLQMYHMQQLSTLTAIRSTLFSVYLIRSSIPFFFESLQSSCECLCSSWQHACHVLSAHYLPSPNICSLHHQHNYRHLWFALVKLNWPIGIWLFRVYVYDFNIWTMIVKIVFSLSLCQVVPAQSNVSAAYWSVEMLHFLCQRHQGVLALVQVWCGERGWGGL